MLYNQGKEEGGMVKYDVLMPCGLHHDSTVTIVGKPVKNFYVQLMEKPLSFTSSRLSSMAMGRPSFYSHNHPRL